MSNGPSPEELEQQRRYLEDFLLNAVRLLHFASCNPPLVAFYCFSACISSGLGSADNSDYISRFQLGRKNLIIKQTVIFSDSVFVYVLCELTVLCGHVKCMFSN